MLFCLSYLLCYVIKDVTMRTDQTHCSFFLTCGVYGIDSTVFVYLLYVPVMYEFKVKSDMDSFCKPWLHINPFIAVIEPGMTLHVVYCC